MSNVLNLSLENIKLLEENGINLDYLDSAEDVTVTDRDGNFARGAHICTLVVTDLIEEFMEELTDCSSEKISDEDLCEHYGYDIECESPLEIRSKIGNKFATGCFAKTLLLALRERFNG